MTNANQQAREKLAELIEAAHKGMIIPVRLAGQLEEIAALMDAATQGSESASSAPPDVPADVDEVLKDHAKFVSVAVHELRTPMTSIRGYSDMLGTGTMGELNPMQQQFLETIRTNARRMESLLQDVNDVSKIRAGTLKTTQKMDMFKNIAMTIENETRPIAEELSKSLTFEIPQGLPLLNIDGEFFAKAVRKLVENGLRYSGEDGAVTVRASGDGSDLVVEIIDNGVGMTPEEIEMLGTLYWRGDNDTVRAFKGSGLGVPVAFGIFDLLECRYKVSSTPNEGTQITVRVRGMV